MSTGFQDVTPGNLVVRYCTNFLEGRAASVCRTLKMHLEAYGKKRFFACFVTVCADFFFLDQPFLKLFPRYVTLTCSSIAHNNSVHSQCVSKCTCRSVHDCKGVPVDAMKAYGEEGGGIGTPLLNLSSRCRRVFNLKRRPLYPLGKNYPHLIPIKQQPEWVEDPVWTLPLSRIEPRFLACPAPSVITALPWLLCMCVIIRKFVRGAFDL